MIYIIWWARSYQALPTKTQVASNQKDPYSQRLPKLPQSGPEVDNNPNDLYNICLTETMPDP